MITKNDIKMLKTCDSITFHHFNEATDCNVNFDEFDHGLLSLIKRNQKDEWQGEYDLRYYIEVKSVVVISSLPGKPFRCFHNETVYHWDKTDHIHSVLSLLRENDKIELVWMHDGGTSKMLKEKGLVSDMLQLKIIRKDKIKYEFLIERSLTGLEDRMCKEV